MGLVIQTGCTKNSWTRYKFLVKYVATHLNPLCFVRKSIAYLSVETIVIVENHRFQILYRQRNRAHCCHNRITLRGEVDWIDCEGINVNRETERDVGTCYQEEEMHCGTPGVVDKWW